MKESANPYALGIALTFAAYLYLSLAVAITISRVGHNVPTVLLAAAIVAYLVGTATLSVA